jgi:small nuclear ribonucleoprotein (snRNP)-like protein
MDLTNYLNRRVLIVLSNGFTFVGLCIEADEDSITIIDKNNSHVSLKETNIISIQEKQQ